MKNQAITYYLIFLVAVVSAAGWVWAQSEETPAAPASHTPPPPAQGAPSWWEQDQAAPATPTVQTARGEQSASQINWEDGYIEAVGWATVNMAQTVNRAQAEIMVLEGARTMAYAKLAEAVNGVAVTAETLVEQCVTTDQVARSQTRAIIKGARILEEKVEWVGEAPKGIVRLGLVLQGQQGVQVPMFEWTLRTQVEQRIPLFQPATPPPPPSPSDPKYSGIVIDARGLGLQPAMCPQVLTDDGKLVYGASVVDRNSAIQSGMATYATSLTTGAAMSRVGNQPLMLRATSLFGAQNAGVHINAEAALHTAGEVAKFLLRAAKVLFLI